MRSSAMSNDFMPGMRDGGTNWTKSYADPVKRNRIARLQEVCAKEAA